MMRNERKDVCAVSEWCDRMMAQDNDGDNNEKRGVSTTIFDNNNNNDVFTHKINSRGKRAHDEKDEKINAFESQLEMHGVRGRDRTSP